MRKTKARPLFDQSAEEAMVAPKTEGNAVAAGEGAPQRERYVGQPIQLRQDQIDDLKWTAAHRSVVRRQHSDMSQIVRELIDEAKRRGGIFVERPSV